MSPTRARARAPKKYLDPDRVEVSAAWLAWREQMREESLDMLPPGFDPAVYFPERYYKAIPEEGAWVLVLEEPFTELQARFRVPVLSMWRARPHTLSGCSIIVGRTKAAQIRISPKQAVIATPGGDLHLWPHEYMIVNDPAALISCEGAVLHALGGQPVLDTEHLFYLRSRGIPYHEAVLLLMSQVSSQDWGFVTFPEEVTAQLEGVGQPLWRHIQRHPRKAVS